MLAKSAGLQGRGLEVERIEDFRKMWLSTSGEDGTKMASIVYERYESRSSQAKVGERIRVRYGSRGLSTG
jgi:hypothetical protein